jgi:hypothetical protein
MASKYHEMWRAHYGAIEKQLPRENVLYLKYEDLKDKSKRVNALAGLTRFLGVESSPEHLECAFVLAENPGAHRKTNAESMTKKVAYTKPVACRMWNLFGKAATRVGYSVWENMQCEGFPPIHNVNVGPQGEYVFCYTIVLPSFLVCDVSVSLLSAYGSLLTLSDTT